jgi:hypothetical protein
LHKQLEHLCDHKWTVVEPVFRSCGELIIK